MNIKIGRTRSVCPVCLKQIQADRVLKDGEIYLEKTCSEHGDFSTVIWRSGLDFQQWRREQSQLKDTENLHCIEQCGICDEHLQGTCCVLYEVTRRCNLNCRFCFAGTDGVETITLKQIKKDISAIFQRGQALLQLSGGEPTMREDLPEIVAHAKACGFKYVQLNSNGIRLAEDEAYLAALAKAGLSFVFMQFDGTNDEIYLQLRGKPLFQQKLNAIENCGKYKIGVTLVPTLVPGVNTDDIGNIIQFAVANSPAVRGVHFQPVAYFGRYPSVPGNDDRYTLDQLLGAIPKQTEGLIQTADFAPSHCDHPLCGFHGSFIVTSNHTLKPLTSMDHCGCCTATAEQNREYIGSRWQRDKYEPETETVLLGGSTSFDAFLSRAYSHAFTVTAMAFQDCYTLDIERLRRCSLHVYSQGRLIPFCAHYLTALGGGYSS